MPKTVTVNLIGRELALSLLEGARTEAERLGILVACAVVDRGGHLVAAERMDGAATCAFPLALAKAQTAAATLAPTAAWFASTQPGAPDWGMSAVLGGRFTAMPGGIPVLVGAEIVGAVGVSGGEASEDVRCAESALSRALPDG